MTDEQIIKALECCKMFYAEHNNYHCNDCPLNDCKECETTVFANALDLINRLQSENERLTKCRKEEVEKLMWATDKVITEAKAEAIKEFAEDVEYELLHKEYWKDHPYTSQVWLNGYEQCMRDIRVMLKDKVKEMVGDME